MHQNPVSRERRDYFYFSLAIIVALAITALNIGVREQAATDEAVSISH